MKPVCLLLSSMLLAIHGLAANDDPWITRPQPLSEHLGVQRTVTPVALPPNPDAAWQKKAETVRPMATDRPDQTDGVYTVPKGMFQFETGLFNYSRRLDTDYRNEAFIWGEVNAKYGLTDSIDLQLIWQAWAENRYRGDPGNGEPGYYREGVNDLVARVKFNLFGNDGGSWAMSVVPFVKIPTAKHKIGNDMWEGGVSINSEIDLGGGFTLGNTLYSQILADNDDTLHFSPTVTAVLGYEVTDSFVVYGEIYGQNRVDTERYWQTSFDAGFMYSITPNVIFDAGANWFFRGDEAINPFVGLSWRF